uniref:SLC12A transporter C-terminal domain-containing protein n=1 Tax=Romanomermis culicivorax TaxID=13658 RepID=A0A915KKL1_ROMCU
MDGSLDSMSNAPYGPSLPPHCPASLAFPGPVAKAFSPSDSGRFSYSIRQYSMMQKEVLAHINQFRRKLKNPEIHVYWLADDGGLTLLIPHILANNKSCFYGAKLRIFTVAASPAQVDEEERKLEVFVMRILLEKFRIEFVEVTVISDLHKEPNLATVLEFEQMIKPFCAKNVKDRMNEQALDTDIFITEEELDRLRPRTNRYLRVREVLLEYSKKASLIVLTQPVPRKGGVSACLYLAWLEMISKDFSPLLFLRGNQQSVLTFYS